MSGLPTPASSRAGTALRVAGGSRVTREITLDQHELISRERERFARDLHDVALGRLSELCFELSSIRQSQVSSHNWGLVDARIQAVIDDVDVLIRELRNLVFDLHNTPAPGLGIEDAMRELLEEAEAQLGCAVHHSVAGPVASIPRFIAQHVQAVAEEAVRNAILHSQATHLSMTLMVHEDAVELLVTDDGVGPPEVPAQGLGMGSMAARARLLRGSLRFGPGAMSGSVLRWRVPY